MLQYIFIVYIIYYIIYLQVLFSDEAHFLVQGQQVSWVWKGTGSPLREGHIVQRKSSALRRSCFGGALAIGKPGRLHLCEGTMNSDQYIHVINTTVIQEMRERFPDGDGIFQQDLVSCRKAKAVNKVF